MNLRPRLAALAVTVLAAFVVTPHAQAHIDLLKPDGGEKIDGGSTYTIEWIIIISHDLLNWDLWYSHEGPTGPWTEVAMDLPGGDSTPGTIHTYEWTVPDEPDDTVWFRVRMDNEATDYEGISEASFTINCVGDLDGDGSVAFGDLLIVLSSWGPCGKDCPADLDASGAVDFNDLLTVLSRWGACGPA